MTLISMSLNHGCPILIGDVLLSSQESDGQIKTPSFMHGTRDILKNMEGGKPINKLVQKLYIINPQLCIALGGRLDQMYSFLRAIRSYFQNHLPTEEEYMDFLDNYENEKKTELIAIVLYALKEENNRVKFISHSIGDWKIIEHNVFERVFANGSGREDYIKELNFAFNNIRRHGDSPKEPFLTAVTNNLMVIARFLGLESTTAQTLLKNWGAAFEMILFVNGEFKKLDHITFLTMVGTKSVNNSVPLNCLKFFYSDEALIVRSNGTGQEQIFYALPIDKEDKYKSFEVVLPDYNSNVTLIFYNITMDDGESHTPTLVIPNNLETPLPMVKVITDNSRLEIMISTEINEELDKYISENIRLAN